ncbi:predicted protein [Plenodomus lingam JN3]|uniref:Predicted protein n=1 Tax=Leptosphaeria maculans (strain JN3 / isolate v23.1.3 / race Av1-4-5-6-7-8) TaxID=985895 RepID=E4ZT26_LEPMJ|nr:predicted protein [Plenodomus lingam JN3]CBX94457.1 predicted protein [Plenodomus lingam JN3]
MMWKPQWRKTIPFGAQKNATMAPPPSIPDLGTGYPRTSLQLPE